MEREKRGKKAIKSYFNFLVLLGPLVVETPDGRLGVEFGSGGVATSDLPINQFPSEEERPQEYRDAGFLEDCFHNQGLLTDRIFLAQKIRYGAGLGVIQNTGTDQHGIDREVPLTSNPHAMKTNSNSILTNPQIVSIVKTIGTSDRVEESFIRKNWSLID